MNLLGTHRDLYNLRNWHIVVLTLAASVLNGIVHNVAYLMARYVSDGGAVVTFPISQFEDRVRQLLHAVCAEKVSTGFLGAELIYLVQGIGPVTLRLTN
jgi:hypothetical protein